MARRAGVQLGQQQVLGPTVCGVQEAGIKSALGPGRPQASPMGSLIAHIHEGVFETDLFYISVENKACFRQAWMISSQNPRIQEGL